MRLLEQLLDSFHAEDWTVGSFDNSVEVFDSDDNFVAGSSSYAGLQLRVERALIYRGYNQAPKNPDGDALARLGGN